MTDEQLFRIDYRKYVETAEGPNPAISYDDYSIISASQIGVKFGQFLDGKINDLEIDSSSLNMLKDYLESNRNKPLDNILAASLILANSGIDIDKDKIYEQFKKHPKFVSKYQQKFLLSKLRYMTISASPKINSKSIEYDFLK